MSNTLRKGRSENYLADYVRNPLKVCSSSTMPAYDLTAGQLKDLAAFLLALDFRDAKAVAKPVSEILGTSKAAQTPQAGADAAAPSGS